MKRSVDDEAAKQKRRRRLLAESNANRDDGKGGFNRLVEAAESQDVGDDGNAKETAEDQAGNSEGEQETSDDNNDVGDNESQEASDVAVVASIRSKSPRVQSKKPKPKKEDHSEEPDANDAGDDEGIRVTHPNPKNFAERLMFALEKGMGSEVISWAGEGMAVAIHPKKLKKDSILESHFRVKNYGAFIRNCNRWGFKRVNCYSVPDGQVTYECSLFRKNQPHLVKHMRMDSDVQDVFARHHVEEKKQTTDSMLPQAVPQQILDSKPAAVPGMPPGSQQQQHPIGMSVNFQQLQQPQPSQEQLINSLMGKIAQNSQGGITQGPPGLLGQPQQNGNELSMLLASLLQGQDSSASQATSDPTRVRETLFAQILQHSAEYLNRPQLDSPYDATIRTVLHLLQNHVPQSGGTHLQDRHSTANSHPQSLLGAQLGQSISTFSPVSVPSNSGDNAISDMASLLSANNSQSQPQPPPVPAASMLQQILAQHGGGHENSAEMRPQPVAPALPPAQQQPQSQPNAQPPQQQVPNVQELLRMLLQHQQGGN